MIELAEAGISHGETLVGGLMVAMHARRAGLVMRRPTDDVDVLVDYAANRARLAEMRAELSKLGFELDQSSRVAYRFAKKTGGRSTWAGGPSP